jgi:hypothetical protein
MRSPARQRALPLALLLAILSLGALGLDEPARQGKVLSVASGPQGMTAVLEILPGESAFDLGQGVSVSGGAGEKDLGGGALRVQPGMRVHLVIQFGGAVLRPVVGVVTAMLSGERCEATIDPVLLEKTVQDPRDGSKHAVREFLAAGAEVSIAED